MFSRIRIEMFGGLRVQVGNREITRFSTQKAGALLAYLARYPESHPRDSLVEMLWPDGLPEAGRASLSQALSTLRRQLEPPGVSARAVIISTKSHAGLNPESVVTDVGDFLTALRASKVAANRLGRIQVLQGAIDLYRGELLPGFYEEWVLAEQRRLADMFFQAADTLVALLEESGEHFAAIDYARRTVEIDPLREEGHQQIMRLCAATGRRADALGQYVELKRILEEKLGEEPSSETRKLADVIERMEDSPSPSTQAPRTTPRERGPSRQDLPRGTVTFLLTDIAGSTDQWEKDRVRDHYRLMRQQFAVYGGHEIKEAGDSFLVAFESPSSAVACAIAAQKALNHEGLQGHKGLQGHLELGGFGEKLDICESPLVNINVRMALLTGEVKLEAGEYHGPALHRASRILSAAHGGQILCSESVASIVRRDLPSDIRLVDLGIYRLRDVHVPERLFQVHYDAMPQADFPRLNAEAGYQSTLPLQFTRFFGREEQLAQLSKMLPAGDTHLVTITGPGGTGKTRLALEVANRLLEPFDGAVWFVPLVDLSDARLIAGAIVDSMRIPRSPTADPLDQAVEALNRQRSLLILDNLEQFVEEGGQIIRLLLERVPLLTCLVTSRQSLSVAGEREFPLVPLATPNGPGTPQQLTMFESVRLFVDRAQAVRPDFQVTNHNAPAVAELCDRLEGIPLAIELAAARASVFGPSQMLLQLERRFDFLVSRRRDAFGHHGTLRAAMDWSFDLLPPEIQRFFARLSVFRGGWTVEAAQAVCDEPLALDHLTLLRDCSLILAEESDEGIRFRMLETLREYAEERLSPDEHAAAHTGHLEFFLHLAEEAEPHLQGPDQAEWLDTLAVEHDNLRTALDGCETAEGGLRLSASLQRFWQVRGHWSEGRERLGHALTQPESQGWKIVRAKALNGAGALAQMQADYASAQAHYEESLSIGREIGNPESIANSLSGLGNVACHRCDYDAARAYYEESLSIRKEIDDRQGVAITVNDLGDVAKIVDDYPTARAHYEESLAILREVGDRQGIADLQQTLGTVAHREGDYPTALTLYEGSLAIQRELGNRRGIAVSLLHVGLIVGYRGDYPAARAHIEESLAITRDIGDRVSIAKSLVNLGRVVKEQGDYAAAGPLFEESLAILREIGDRLNIAYALHGLGEVATELADYPAAGEIYEECLAIRRGIGDRFGTAETLINLGVLAADQGNYGMAQAHYEESLSIVREIGARVLVVRLLLSFAALAAARQQPKRGAQLWGVAEVLREARGSRFTPFMLEKYNRSVAAARAMLSDTDFRLFWEQGRAMTLEQAIEHALQPDS